MNLLITGDPHRDIPNLLDAMREAFERFMQVPVSTHFDSQQFTDGPKATRFAETAGSMCAEPFRNAKVTEPAMPPDVVSQCRFLERQIEENIGLSAALGERIERYMHPDSDKPSESGEAFPSPITEAGDGLRELAERVRQTNSRLRNMLERLEV